MRFWYHSARAFFERSDQNTMTSQQRAMLLCSILNAIIFPTIVAGSEQEHFFETRVRPLLIERCHKCHSSEQVKGGLRLDSREAILHGGDSGPSIVIGNPDDSLLIQAVRQQNGLAMPPEGRLNEGLIADLAKWIKSGALWPGASQAVDSEIGATPVPVSVPPNHGDLSRSLQLWLRADSLLVEDGDPVPVWPDQSGNGRDVSATRGVRTNGVGLPGTYIARSHLQKRPAVRFDTKTGYAASPARPVEIQGDAAFTILVVMNLGPHDVAPPYHGVFGFGNPANPGGDPGRPLAALIQINQGENHALHFAGGWNHDASLGSGSFLRHYGKTIILSIVKRPGPMRTTTRLFINAEEAAGPSGNSLEGRDTVPDIQHRQDIGAYLGKAVNWAGSIQGDIGEVIVYNQALSDFARVSVEGHLAEKYGLALRAFNSFAPPARFTEQERSHWVYQAVSNPQPPSSVPGDWAESPIDQFMAARHQQLGVSPAPPCDKRTLLRRVTFDLTGLPPTPEEISEFLGDDSPCGLERVVDRLLNSPPYGERWGRHWLDVVRYAESTANDANAVMRYAWRYRNYVIDAFNRDLPYDQFLTEQLAGDLLPATEPAETIAQRIIATGFLMIGPKALAEADKEQSRLDIVDDQIDVVSRSMLGLTIGCARCHDHKFDAIRTTDYYALAGIFRSIEPFQNEDRNATMWWEFPVSPGSGKEPITVMAPKESTPRDLRVHLRGNRFTLGATVPRGTIQIIDAALTGRLPAASHNPPTNSVPTPISDGSGRLELARWITDRRNPLTARVMVNRIWQHHFGLLVMLV